MSGQDKIASIREAVSEIIRPLVGSTLTPVVVFVPSPFLEASPGFFRALALTMVVALLTSLALAVTLTPSLANWLIRPGGASRTLAMKNTVAPCSGASSSSMKRECGPPQAAGLTVAICAGVMFLAVVIYKGLTASSCRRWMRAVLSSITSPARNEPGRNPSSTPVRGGDHPVRAELESYSRRTGAQLGLFITEPNNGDFLLKLRPDRKRSTQEVLSELRHRLNAALPDIIWEFRDPERPYRRPDVRSQPIEVKLFSTDTAYLKERAPGSPASWPESGESWTFLTADLHRADHQFPRSLYRCERFGLTRRILPAPSTRPCWTDGLDRPRGRPGDRHPGEGRAGGHRPDG